MKAKAKRKKKTPQRDVVMKRWMDTVGIEPTTFHNGAYFTCK